jgi:hypothetical protein
MRLSEERIGHIGHMIADAIWKDDLLDFMDEGKARNEIKKILLSYFSFENQADDRVRAKIRNMARKLPEGSQEWQIEYERFMRQELAKKGW